MGLPPTPSQTVGPFFHIGIDGWIPSEVVSPSHPDAVRLFGTVRDGEGEPVIDALIEIWQANAVGRYAHPEDTRDELPLEEGFTGFGRACTDDDGRFEFVTVKPGPVPGRGGQLQAPHIAVSVFARGVLKRLATRIYFPDEADANAADPVLSSIEDADARSALVASEEDGGLRFDIHLQGDRETTFFAV
ncbi:MAG: protocatechuate 3,4-dioxygenase, alpha subunit [Thermoleophilaceae bacterium]|nr:protocatechuate 3,4-dioxygenase, alpha subunit [Thermoleophilaceae bacterium]